ncbi:tetratricopeptide repeat protein [Vibrio kyushuensis]|uniref:tetratricopeptide repeat protein n=1 Tax=Vibrio kyushuensis TaxID=2910249 RepID=UPI003D136A0A
MNKLENLTCSYFSVILTGVILIVSHMSFATEVQVTDKLMTELEQQEALLAEYSQSEALGLEQRISATVALGDYYGANAMIAVARASRSEYQELRIAAIQAAAQWQGKAKWDVVSPLLNDPNGLVKNEAVRTLIVLWPVMSQSYIEILEPSVDEYLDNLPASLEGDLERAWFYRTQSKHQLSEALYLEMHATYSDPRISIVQAEYLNSADKNEQAISVLEVSLFEFPSYAPTYYSLGLAYHRENNSEEAITHLERSYEIDPNSTTFGYAYATLVGVSNPMKAAQVFQDIYELNPESTYLYAWCNALLSAGQAADTCLIELEKVAPKEIVADLRQRY